jgi:hypothetical protein
MKCCECSWRWVSCSPDDYPGVGDSEDVAPSARGVKYGCASRGVGVMTGTAGTPEAMQRIKFIWH